MKKELIKSVIYAKSSLTFLGVSLLLTGCASTSMRFTQERGSPPETAAQTPASDNSKDTEAMQNTQKAQRNTEASAEYHFAMAQAYVAEGNPDRAIEEYKLTLMFDPDSALVHARLAAEYVKKGMLSSAMEECKEAVRIDPEYTDARLMLAGLYSSARESGKSVAEYDRILKTNPRHEEAAVYRAQVLMESGRIDEAAKSLREYTRGNSEAFIAYYYLGRAEQARNQIKAAETAYRRSLELRPAFSQAGLALGFLYEEKGMNAKAVAVYKDLYESNQELAAANRLATILLKQEKYLAAVPYLEAIASADPDDMNARVKLGLLRMELKQFEAAIQEFQAILKKAPDSDRILYYLGSVYEETRRPEQAMVELRKIKPSSKLFPDAALHVGYLLKQAKKMEEAREYIKGAIAASPESASLVIFAASLEEERKDLPSAIALLENAALKFSDDEKLRYYLGSLYDRSGNIEKGLEQMEAIIRVNPENVDALNYIGYTWTLKGIRLNDAEKLLKRAIGLRPDNGYIQDSWGWHLFVRGRTHEAIVELEKAAKLKPDESTILEHLADAYVRSNLREKALTRYRDAIRHAEDDESRRKIEAKLQTLSRELAGAEDADRPQAEPRRMPASERPQTPR